MTEIKADELPDIAKEIERLIGLEPTMRLVKTFGGDHLIHRDKPFIVSMIGTASADALFNHFGDRRIVIPRCAAALKRVRDERIKDAYDKGTSIRQLTMLYSMTRRHIWRILNGSA